MSAATPKKNAVTVIDAGVGNSGNVLRALRHLGAEASFSADPAAIAASSCLVLPGVGAFRPPRERLYGEMEAALRTALAKGAHLLGVCVGYQLLFEASTEFGATPGLALLGGTVDVLPAGVPLPHIGWNRLVASAAAAGHPLLAGMPAEAYVYFVHSYAPFAVPEEQVLARTRHGAEFAAMAGQGRVFGCQFHPEKSGSIGLLILHNFLRLAEAA